MHLPADADVGALRRESGAALMIGVSAHSIGDARRAATAGADYVTLSPVFVTPSKPGYGPALGEQGLRDAAARLRIPLIALAGVTEANADLCLAADLPNAPGDGPFWRPVWVDRPPLR